MEPNRKYQGPQTAYPRYHRQRTSRSISLNPVLITEVEEENDSHTHVTQA